MGYVFISYSHADSQYARRLARHCEERRIPVWIDERIDYGTEWPNVIESQLDGCSALILVMTPSARKSTWVQNELARAKRKNKQIFPLLLEGNEPWLSVEALQYVDVRGSTLPPQSFFAGVEALLPRAGRGKVLLYEANFREESTHWVEETSSKYKSFRRGDCFHVQVSHGKYERYYYTGFELSDFHVSVDSQFLPTSDMDAQCGIVFRVDTSDPDPGYYRFSISRTGSYALHAKIFGQWTTIVDYTKSNDLRTTGEFNSLAVQMQKTAIRLELNGVALRSLDDYRLPAGRVGLFVTAMTEGLCAEARFRNFRLSSLGEP